MADHLMFKKLKLHKWTEAAKMESAGEIVYEKETDPAEEAALAVEVEAALAGPREVGGRRFIRSCSHSLSPRRDRLRSSREGGGRLRSRSPL